MEEQKKNENPVVFLTNRGSLEREEWTALRRPCRCGEGWPGHWLIGQD